MSDDLALKRMSKLVNYLMSRHDSGPFLEPVDWKALDLYDYPKIIKKMMDLGTVKRKLERGQYENAKDCAQDIRLIWTNCKTYNADGSDFYLLAESFSKRFEDRYKKIQAEFDTGDDEKKKSSHSQKAGMSLDVKTKFASNLFRLSGMEIGHVLQVIDLKCPQALEHPQERLEVPLSDRFDCDTGVEINVDAIDSKTFAELDRYVKQKMHTRTAGESLSEYEATPKKQKR